MSADRSSDNRDRAESFGAAAERYDLARPSYPDALIDELVAEPTAVALDVGCGTGKAARLLAARGVDVLGVEVDERMAQVARGHGVAVETSPFETWEPAGRTFDLVLSGQAWHWVDPVAGPQRAADVLRPGGRLALFWNFVELESHARAALDGAYASVGEEVSRSSVLCGAGPGTLAVHLGDVVASGRFGPVRRHEYDWQQTYTRDRWLAMVTTHSDHLTLPPQRLAAVTAAVGAAIDRLGGSLRAYYRTYALIAATC